MDNETRQFALNPDTVSIIIKSSEYVLNILRENPNVRLGNVLQDRYVITFVNRNNLDEVLDILGTNFLNVAPLVYGLLDAQSLQSAGISQVHDQEFIDLKGQGALVGIIDTGIDYTNNAFKYEDGTSKIVSIFDETIETTPPYDFAVGTEYTNEQINSALASENPFDIVPSRDTDGHGTFLASIAAGRENGEGFRGAAPDAELIVVKLRKARSYWLERYLVPPEQENVYDGVALMGGIEYIVRKARELNRPVAICIGLGSNQGGHNGYSVIEEYLRTLSSSSGICICTAAGNESQARHHTMGTIGATGETRNIEFRVAEVSNVYLIIRNRVSDRMSVSIKSPAGEVVGRVPAKSGTMFSSSLILERARVNVEYYFPLAVTGGQATIVKIIDATPGLWTVTVHGDIVLEGTFHAYLPMAGLGPTGLEFLSPTPNYTIVLPATSFGVITCGAYDSSSNALYSDSSWGPTALDYLMPCLTAPGVNVGGIFPGGQGTMTGTSVAAAITTGACALMLQWGIVQGNDVSLSSYQIRAFLLRGCERDINIVYPNNQWGYGRLNLINTFTMMREL
ncbi:MAG: S8 family peptidase [Clostridiales bacterium]|nr:S8 family peptidase [Clostridiales bacterium]